MRVIKAYHGEDILVDDEDYEKLSKFKWNISTSHGYPQTSVMSGLGKVVTYKMHHLIIGYPPTGMDTHHKDDNRKNNQRVNLEFLSRYKHKRKHRVNTESGYHGVHGNGSKWQAKIQHNKIKYILGTFISKVDAAKAVDKKLIELYGSDAELNFPPEPGCAIDPIATEEATDHDDRRSVARTCD